MAHLHLHPGLVREISQVLLPRPHPVAIGASSVCVDQQSGRHWVAATSLPLPPATQGGNCERGGVAATAHPHPACADSDVVDPVGDGFERTLFGKVVGTDVHRLPGAVPPLTGRSR